MGGGRRVKAIGGDELLNCLLFHQREEVDVLAAERFDLFGEDPVVEDNLRVKDVGVTAGLEPVPMVKESPRAR